MEVEKSEIRKWLEVLANGTERNKNLFRRIIKIASRPKRRRIVVDLGKLDTYANDADNIVVPGKVLGAGLLRKKFSISAVGYSESALESLNLSGCEILSIEEMTKRKKLKILV